MNPIITKSIRIHQGRVISDGITLMENREVNVFGEFIRLVYKFAGMSYPKFYKMDDLCKLGLVAAELCLNGRELTNEYGKDKIGLVVQNGSSTIDTDKEYQRTIDDRENYFPSPAVFVYTLPNIMLGEICIKNKIFGENALMIEDSFRADSLHRHTSLLFGNGRIHASLTGWIELNAEHYDAFLCLVESDSGKRDGMPFTADSLGKLYQIQ